MAAGDEMDDIQALVRSGFGTLGAARYLLLRISDAARVKSWLAAIEPTRASQIRKEVQLEHVLQIAFTRAGLEALGFSEADLAACAPEFLDGMAGDESRSHRLGDVGDNAPSAWSWGVGTQEPHILLLLLAHNKNIADWAGNIEAQALAAGCTLIAAFASCPAREDGGPSREPFGFADGLSQPEIDWRDRLDVTAAANGGYRDSIAAGEVLLGHRNEYDFIADYPQGKMIGRNGSYLVYRQLEQDVSGFWKWLAGETGSDRAPWLAERMVGRGMDGKPLVNGASGDTNSFLFQDDPEGLVCPLGAHIRRANPRSGDAQPGRHGLIGNLLSTLGLVGDAANDAVASARFHRLLRRGRPYGETLTPQQAMRPDQPKVEAGLHFMCLNASLARQFEFVQGAWVMSPTFGGLNRQGDPLMGNRLPFPKGCRTDLFRYHDEKQAPRIAQGLPNFVTVRGGAYFFLPGIAGLRSIAAA